MSVSYLISFNIIMAAAAAASTPWCCYCWIRAVANPKSRELMIEGAGFHDAGNEPISTVHGSEF